MKSLTSYAMSVILIPTDVPHPFSAREAGFLVSGFSGAVLFENRTTRVSGFWSRVSGALLKVRIQQKRYPASRLQPDNMYQIRTKSTKFILFGTVGQLTNMQLTLVMSVFSTVPTVPLVGHFSWISDRKATT
jgi:hypothetical protein